MGKNYIWAVAIRGSSCITKATFHPGIEILMCYLTKRTAQEHLKNTTYKDCKRSDFKIVKVYIYDK